ncbi:MAG: phosphoadenylyl-sulfate reductase [Holosporales bacterium]|jgi:phosphoadenosine phosphosulfate reductase
MTAISTHFVDNEALDGLTAKELLTHALTTAHANGDIAAVSSFGAESVVLLHLIAQIKPETPILFLETNKLFPETLTYMHTVQHHLGLQDVRLLAPAKMDVDREDPQGTLWFTNADRCCFIRKVLPLQHALLPFRAWINGRKRFQSSSRASIPLIENDGARIKYNPLARWDASDLETYIVQHNLPRHPLTAHGYTSIGCAPCTALPVDGSNGRSGRWAGQDKLECGIHYTI